MEAMAAFVEKEVAVVVKVLVAASRNDSLLSLTSLRPTFLKALQYISHCLHHGIDCYLARELPCPEH